MRNIITYSIYQLYKGKKITLITLAMVVVSFCVMEYTIFDYFAVRVGEYYAKDIISYEDDDVYRVDVSKYIICSNGESLENINKFYKDVKCVDGIEHCGMYFCDSDEVVYSYGDIMAMFGVDLDAYQSYDEIEGQGRVWVGSDLLNDYSIGDEYIFEARTRCRVVGIIPANKKMLSGSFYEYGNVVALDEKIVVQMDSVPEADMYLPMCLNDFYFCIDKHAKSEMVLSQIYDIGERCKIDINGIVPLKKIYKNIDRQLISQAGESYLLPFVMLMASVMGLIISTMISIKTNARDAGIMVANGMSIKALSGIYIFENVIKIIMAVVVAYFYCIDKVKNEYEGYYEIYKLASKSYILIILMVVVISNLFILLYFKNKLPCELIGGAYD